MRFRNIQKSFGSLDYTHPPSTYDLLYRGAILRLDHRSRLTLLELPPELGPQILPLIRQNSLLQVEVRRLRS